jgi:hypothetical protein
VLTTSPPPTVNPDLVTDRAEYRASVDSLFTNFTVGFRFTNPGPDSTYIPFCRAPVSPILEKWLDERWVMVYQNLEMRCQRLPPLFVAPGASLTHALEVAGARPGRNFVPEFNAASASGYYRLLWIDVGQPQRRALSNVFRVVE